VAVDYFLKIDGIEGESTDSKHKGEIEIESFSWGVSQSGTIGGGGGGGAGKAQFQDFSFTAVESKASPKLFVGCASGEHIKQAVLTGRTGRDFVKGEDIFLKLTLTDVLISSYQTGGSQSSDTLPIDQVSLNFAKIEFSHTSTEKSGTGETVTAMWDVKENRGG
jgi:type VI secretion system secreted protein Hcp